MAQNKKRWIFWNFWLQMLITFFILKILLKFSGKILTLYLNIFMKRLESVKKWHGAYFKDPYNFGGENTVQKIIIFSDSQNIKPIYPHYHTLWKKIFFWARSLFKAKNYRKMCKNEKIWMCGTTRFLVLFLICMENFSKTLLLPPKLLAPKDSHH